MNSKSIFDEIDVPKDKEPDMCKCSECFGVFKVDECEQDHGHHDGWEMPAYTEILCPKCEDGGCIDDFFFSGGSDE